MPDNAAIRALFCIAPAKTWRYFILFSHILALLAIAVSAMLVWLQLSMGVAVVAACGWQWRKAKQAPVQIIRYASSTGWSIVKDAQEIAIEILPSTLMLSNLIIIHYRELLSPRLQTLVCFSDSLSRSEYQKLWLLLKLYALQKKQLQV